MAHQEEIGTLLKCAKVSHKEQLMPGNSAEIINLYDVDFKDCRACSACKLKDGKNYGVCSYPDELKEILNKV